MTNSLFSGGDDWTNNACLNWSHHSMRLYIEGYRVAADELVHGLAQNRAELDILVYPICFLYRQYIELQLKLIIRESRILLEDGSSFPQNHQIKDLWDITNDLRSRIIREHDESIKNYITQSDVAEVGKLISDFVEFDPKSLSFRYPLDKHGENSLEGIRHINISNLHGQMKWLKKKLDKYELAISPLIEWQQDMRAEYRP